MIVVTLYFEPNQSSSMDAKSDLEDLKREFDFQFAQVDISTDPHLYKEYSDQVPQVQIGPYRLKSPFTIQDLRVTLGAAINRDSQLNTVGDMEHYKRVERGHTLSGADKISYWISRHYMGLICFLLFIYVGLPFAAPALAKIGWIRPARIIYAVYSPFCHQLPYRSWFLFGEQPYYPRTLAGVEGIGTYEDFFGDNSTKVTTVRKITGIEEAGSGIGQIGYKVALCERDIAIYTSMLLFGLIFIIAGKKIKQLPWYLWVIIGLGPIGLDGVSQLPSLINFLPAWALARESTPVLRSLTGMLFGVTTAWFLYPMIEDSMRETRSMLAGKRVIVPQIQPK